VLIVTRDLFFRAKLEGAVKAVGAQLVREDAADLVVVELKDQDTVARVAQWTSSGVSVIAFASHVQAELLRAARQAGATAVPNSQVENAVGQWLARRC
jgi:hypothetical protein